MPVEDDEDDNRKDASTCVGMKYLEDYSRLDNIYLVKTIYVVEKMEYLEDFWNVENDGANDDRKEILEEN